MTRPHTTCRNCHKPIVIPARSLGHHHGYCKRCMSRQSGMPEAEIMRNCRELTREWKRDGKPAIQWSEE